MTACHSNNENQLLLEAANGNEIAFTKLFYTYHQKLADYIYKLTESVQSSQDIVQDVFTRLWIYRENLSTVENFDAYLYRMARNQTFTALKKISREQKQISRLTMTTLMVQHTEAEENDIDKTYSLLLNDAVANLSGQQKKIYELSRIKKMKYGEISSRLNISAETVKKHMHLALNSIRKYVLIHKDVFSLTTVSCLHWL